MNSNMDLVLTAALTLPNGDRVELVEAILASLQSEDHPPFDESWHPVIRSGSMSDQGFGIVAAAASPTGGFCWS